MVVLDAKHVVTATFKRRATPSTGQFSPPTTVGQVKGGLARMSDSWLRGKEGTGIVLGLQFYAQSLGGVAVKDGDLAEVSWNGVAMTLEVTELDAQAFATNMVLISRVTAKGTAAESEVKF